MKWRRVGIGAGVVLALAAVVGGAALWWWTHSGRAQRSGEVALAGLTAKVDVRFDEWGVPCVSGASLDDVVSALGWLHANDRIGQMELQRRAATGRLSELLGERTLAVDMKMRWLRFARTAERMWNALAPEHQRLLDAYARGVNAWLTSHEHDLPPDLLLLRAAPEPWSGRDSLCVQLMMAHMLSFSAAREQTRFRWLQELGEERTRDLLGDPALHIDQEVLELAKKPIKTSSLIDASTASEQNGSNGWAVSGARGADGHALVASDPHLQLGLPALWYQALLRAPDYEASGMTIPGLPIVVIGQGPHLAWGFTNTELDVCDVFFEQGEHGARDVERNGVAVPTSVSVEHIQVRGGAVTDLELFESDIGPMFEPNPALGLPARSVAWTGWQAFDPFTSFLALARAKSVDEVPGAIASFVCPPQNILCADDRGAILQTVLGRGVERGSNGGALPMPAGDAPAAWKGLADAERNPRIAQPAVGVLVNANDDPALQGTPFPGRADSAAPQRAGRIRELLGARTAWTPQELGAIQTDTSSRYALDVVEQLRALELAPGSDAARARDALLAWNGEMGASGTSALYGLVERELHDCIFGDELRAHHLPPLTHPERDRVLLQALSGKLRANWFDDVSTPAVEDRATTIARALESAWRAGRASWGDDTRAWAWGELHTWRPHHALGDAPLLGKFFDEPEHAMPGCATCPCVFSGPWSGDHIAVVHGASMRFVADVADPDRSLAVLPSGQSGNPFDEHYDDQLPGYLAGALRPMHWSEREIEAHTRSRLAFTPAR
jgi:penicillin amidase